MGSYNVADLRKVTPATAPLISAFPRARNRATIVVGCLCPTPGLFLAGTTTKINNWLFMAHSRLPKSYYQLAS